MRSALLVFALFLCGVAHAELPELARGWEAYERHDYATAIRYLVMAADAGDLRAAEALAEIHERGLGTPPDPEQAFRWRRLADELRASGRSAAADDDWHRRALEADRRQWKQREEARRSHEERQRQSRQPHGGSQFYWGYGIGGPGFYGPHWDPRWGLGYYGFHPYRPAPGITFGFSQWYVW